jgi:DNA-binding NtrC family response regulator
MQTLLLIDTEQDFLDWAARHLSHEAVRCITATTADQGLKLAAEVKPDLVIAELHLKPFTGMDLLKRLRLQDPNAMVILITGFPPTNAVIESMKLGAFDFLRKEALPYDLRPVVEAALKARDELRQQDAPAQASQEMAFELGEHTIIGRSAAMQEVLKLIGRVSRNDAVVLITGESGCGKEIVARAIHRFSPRSSREFVAINCAAIPENLLESELFGHEKGSFTGASQQRIGRFEQCDGGTLFLDEIGDMPLALQGKILRVLQLGEFSRVGGNSTIRTDVRIIAATNRNLEREVEAGRFREDLFYRLNVVRLHLPALRERPEDIRLLANFFLQRIAKKRGNPRLRIAEDTIRLLESYNWPGNVRELENTIQRACALANTDVLLPRDIPLGQQLPRQAEAAPSPSLADAVDFLIQSAGEANQPVLAWITKAVALRVRERNGGRLPETAKALGIRLPALKKLLEEAPPAP